MIPDFRGATEADNDAVAEVYLRSRKELVACAPLVHSDDNVREWIREKLISQWPAYGCGCWRRRGWLRSRVTEQRMQLDRSPLRHSSVYSVWHWYRPAGQH